MHTQQPGFAADNIQRDLCTNRHRSNPFEIHTAVRITSGHQTLTPKRDMLTLNMWP